MTRIAVAGGTGMVGTKVVSALQERGHEVVALARSAGVDLVAGTGLTPVLAGVEQIIDVTSTQSRNGRECADFFGSVARHLQEAGADAGVGRILTLSIVGIDGLDGGGAYGHYVGKLAQEAETKAGQVPTVILRATQFHEFAGQMIDWTAIGPFVPCPKHPAQTVALDTVVEHIVRLVEDPAASGTINLAGPEKRMLIDLIRATAAARGQKVVAVPVWLPGDTPRRVRAGALQAPAEAIIDGPTFDDWLATASA